MHNTIRFATGVLAAVGALGGAPAEAQGPRIRVVVPEQVIRDVVRDVRVTGAVAQTRQSSDRRAEQTDRQTHNYAVGQNGVVELANVSGDISVTAGSGGDVRLEIVRRSRGRTDADAKLGLDRVRAVVDHQGNRLRVRTEYPEERRPPYSVSVSYVVTAPAATRVTATSVSGDITIREIRGDISVNVVSGDIAIDGAARVSAARAVSGDVTVRNATADAVISAGTISGTVLLDRVKAPRINVDVTGGDIIARDVDAESAQLKTLSGDVEFSGPLARGGRYELQSHSGDVVLTTAGGAGFELQASTFSGRIDAPEGMELRNVSRSRRSLRGTVGDGAATVVVTTFSGDVRIGRR